MGSPLAPHCPASPGGTRASRDASGGTQPAPRPAGGRTCRLLRPAFRPARALGSSELEAAVTLRVAAARHRGAGAAFLLRVLWSHRVSGDIPKGRPGGRHGGQGLPLLPHGQEGQLQPGGTPGEQSGQGRRGRDLHLDRVGRACLRLHLVLSRLPPRVTARFQLSLGVCLFLSISHALSLCLPLSPGLRLALSADQTRAAFSVPIPLPFSQGAAASLPLTLPPLCLASLRLLDCQSSVWTRRGTFSRAISRPSRQGRLGATL